MKIFIPGSKHHTWKNVGAVEDGNVLTPDRKHHTLKKFWVAEDGNFDVENIILGKILVSLKVEILKQKTPYLKKISGSAESGNSEVESMIFGKMLGSLKVEIFE